MNIAVIFAGGVGKRMHSKEKPKQFLEMHGKAIIIHTLEVFEHSSEIDAIVIACVKEWIPYLQKLIDISNIKKVVTIVPGGETGQLSIYNGLCAAEKIAGTEKSIVLIHDGVRPLITTQVIHDNINSVKLHGSAITCVTVTETVMIVKADNEIDYIPNRVARAPQSFWLDDVLRAQRTALNEGMNSFIDTCSLMQHYGFKMYLIDGPRENIKITTPEDFYIMRAMLDARENEQIYSLDE